MRGTFGVVSEGKDWKDAVAFASATAAPLGAEDLDGAVHAGQAGR